MKHERAPSCGGQARAWRGYFGWTQQRVADYIGVSKQAIGALENGVTRQLEARHLEKMLEGWGISQAQFWGPVPAKRTKPTKAA